MLQHLANAMVLLIGLLHVYILVLEMFLWDKPKGLKAFGNSLEKAQLTKVMAQNQGLYNGFLAAGLFWSFLATAPFSTLPVFMAQQPQVVRYYLFKLYLL